MVLVLWHLFGVSVWSLLRKISGRRTLGSYKDKAYLHRVLQESVLKLSSAVEIKQLQEFSIDALQKLLPNVKRVLLFLRTSPGPGKPLCTADHHMLPISGVAWECFQRHRPVQSHVNRKDPIVDLLDLDIQEGLLVLCSPVLVESDRLLAEFVIACDQLTDEDTENLDFLKQQFAACFKRLQYQESSNMNIAKSSSNTKSNDSILQLCAELYDQDAASLQVKVIKYLQEQTQAESGFLVLVSGNGEQICQVIGNTVLEEELKFSTHLPHKACIKTLFLDAIFQKTALFLTRNTHQPELKELADITSLDIKSLLGVPVVSRVTKSVIAVACLLNKRGADRFSPEDVDIVTHCFKYTATVLTSTVAFQNERKLKNQTEALLKVAKNLFRHIDDLTKLLREIMQEARNLTKAERCSVFLLDKENNELVAKVFDGNVADTNITPESQVEIRIPANQGIAGHVASTGEILNIRDAYSHHLFYRGVDETTGFRTRHVLCFPIKDDNEMVVGVAQLCNKLDGSYFTTFDEDIARAFSIYCCISIVQSLLYQRIHECQQRVKLSTELLLFHMQQSLLYKKALDAQHRVKLSTELMTFHWKVSSEECSKLTSTPIPKPNKFGESFAKFYYTPRSIANGDTLLACLCMFEDQGFIQRWRIRRETLAKFLIMVRKGYRDPPYHNWSHAFAVAHFCYLMNKNFQLHKYLDDLELFGLFVACLCHDIDHRGTNNTFQVESQSVLAALYSSEGSVLERHHIAQTMCVLNTEGCNIFENLSRKEYERVLDLLRDIILATDLAHHLRIVKDLEEMAKDGLHKDFNHSLLLCLLMTACDLSDQTKDWSNSKSIAKLIYKEFFSQGDLEKAIGRNPEEMMDREKAFVPALQIGFLDHIALPVFRILTKLFPSGCSVYEAVQSNRVNWQHVNEKLGHMKGTSPMEVFEKIEQVDQNNV